MQSFPIGSARRIRPETDRASSSSTLESLFVCCSPPTPASSWADATGRSLTAIFVDGSYTPASRRASTPAAVVTMPIATAAIFSLVRNMALSTPSANVTTEVEAASTTIALPTRL